ncbi:hypothetical protein [Rhodoferax ferrireducens]|uniref:hypothetical protein n=1 Tax=Rhodoferax ferrireducens TaxID=192843 RepID=UPI000E0D363E|nr:hypothetical protein [Rhodoferax ferrireducens]
MKIRDLSLHGGAALLAGTFAQTTSAQVIVGFAGAGGAVSPVPLSPWLTASMAVMLALFGLMFIRRKSGRGVFLLVLSVFAGGGALLQTKDGYAVYATPALFSLVTSGTVVAGGDVAWMTPGPVCGPIGYAWVKSGAGNIAISSIGYAASYSALDPANPPATTDVVLPTPVTPVCSVGTALSGSTSCIVWYQKPGAC